MDLIPEVLEDALRFLGELLQSRGADYEIVVIGGSALMLLDLHIRPTRDLDVLALVEEGEYRLAEPLPEVLREASNDVAATLGLDSNWLNPGPTSQLDLGLPDGFDERVQIRRYGNLTVRLASRVDQIHFKLYAATDDRFGGLSPSKHLVDLLQLDPSGDELLSAAAWARTMDVSEPFQELLIALLVELGVEDAQDVIG